MKTPSRNSGFLIAAGLIGAVAAQPALASLPDFTRYEVILQKQLFGKPPPEVVASPAPVAPPGPSWITEYRMAMLVDEGNGQGRAGLINIKDNSSIILSVGGEQSGIKLVSVDIPLESAVFEKGTDKQTIKMNSGSAIPVASGQPPSAMGASSRMSMGPGRRFGSGRMTPPPPPAAAQPVQPRLTGEQLEAHLKEYQMEVLRKGMPPLPVPLTPEMDAQLVSEGVLPAMDANGNVAAPAAPAATPGAPAAQ
ncbi:MAG: hypothetical protein U1F77_12660 [Kiritimatiellia bacterium]